MRKVHKAHRVRKGDVNLKQIRRRGENNENRIRQNGFRLSESGDELEFLSFPDLEETGLVKHLFSTRIGGVSQGCFGTMNLGFERGDSRENVLENYCRIAEALGCEVGAMTASHQTHTTNIRHVTAADRGKGILLPRDYTDIDGLITDEEGIVLVTYYADCVPLFFVDPVCRAIGLAHSGWRGTAAGMGMKMVKALEEAFGSRAEDLYVAVGPSICADCYEVSEEVAGQFAYLPGTVKPGRAQGKYQLDLWRANKLRLQMAGVRPDRIFVTDICTRCNSDYLFSHRAIGSSRGSLAAFLALK